MKGVGKTTFCNNLVGSNVIETSYIANQTSSTSTSVVEDSTSLTQIIITEEQPVHQSKQANLTDEQLLDLDMLFHNLKIIEEKLFVPFIDKEFLPKNNQIFYRICDTSKLVICNLLLKTR